MIENVRKSKNAPVDSQGCQHQKDDKSSFNDQAFQILIALILSVQTKDGTTDMIMKNLFKFFKNELNIENINKIDDEKLLEIIFEANFNKKKVTYIKSIAKKIKDEYKGIVPDNYDELIKFPGVGPKIAVLLLQCHFNINVGIAVDTHVHRISNRLCWVKTKNEIETKKSLENIFPKEYWADLNLILVGFGQTICKPKNPDCGTCILKNECDFAKNNKKEYKKNIKKK